MSLVAGVIARDVSGALVTKLITTVPAPIFNGGTPVSVLGDLVLAPETSGYVAQVWLGGLPYTGAGALVSDAVNPVVGHVGGLPLTSFGLAVSTHPVAGYVAGTPLDAQGRISVTFPT